MEQNDQNNKKPMNPLVIAGVIYAVVVMVLIGAIIAVKLSRNGGSNNNFTSAIATEPSLELAETVCKKYGGESKYLDEGALDGEAYVIDVYGCEKADDDEDTIKPDEFGFAIEFYSEDNVDAIQKYQATFLATSGQYEVLGYSEDGFFKGYTEIGSPVIQYEVVDKNAYIKVLTSTKSLAEDLLRELGFLNGERADDREDMEDGGEAKTLEPIKAEVRDTQRRDDYSMLVTALNSYLVNNRGTFDDMVNEDNDPRILTASRWINSDGKDPNGNLYDLKAYTYETWSNTDKIPVDDNGSQVFVIIHANCHGTDSNGDPMPAEDASKRAFAVYGYLESDGYFCQASGSAS
ncbi:hypothetical protein J6S55_01780 [Candidatus Saccharibacteria bacterium]|nr:hypothetical protein [Candidatus Saccharibacteria bacterium]